MVETQRGLHSVLLYHSYNSYMPPHFMPKACLLSRAAVIFTTRNLARRPIFRRARAANQRLRGDFRRLGCDGERLVFPRRNSAAEKDMVTFRLSSNETMVGTSLASSDATRA